MADGAITAAAIMAGTTKRLGLFLNEPRPTHNTQRQPSAVSEEMQHRTANIKERHAALRFGWPLSNVRGSLLMLQFRAQDNGLQKM
jgi:hypothetical protein